MTVPTAGSTPFAFGQPLPLADSPAVFPSRPAEAVKPQGSPGLPDAASLNPFVGVDAQFRLAHTGDGASHTQMFVQRSGDATSIHPNDVSQGRSDTCTVLAGVMGLANTDKGRLLISRIVRDNNDGTYSVKLWNQWIDRSHSKVLSMPAGFGDIVNVGGHQHAEIYVKLIEAGYAYGAHHWFDVDLSRDGNRGAPVWLALSALTGTEGYEQTLHSMSDEQYFRVIGDALNKQKLVLTSSAPLALTNAAQRAAAKEWGVTFSHAYAVLGLNRDANTVWLADPHGKRFSLPMEVYRAFFGHVAWAHVP
jgi:Calpain family cysteine protease